MMSADTAGLTSAGDERDLLRVHVLGDELPGNGT